MESDYECHITIETENASALREAIEKMHWHFSMIAGDPVLGPGVRCFATEHFQDPGMAIGMTNLAATLLEFEGFVIIRKKVEHVIFDIRPNQTEEFTTN